MLYRKIIKKIVVSVVVMGLIQGCSFQGPQLHNLTFDKWNEKIELDLQEDMLDELITDFQIFSNEFKNSKLIPAVSLKIINYLIINKKWEEAISFINTHLQRFNDGVNEDYLHYLIIKVRFNLLSKPDRLQRKYIELLNLMSSYPLKFPKSPYLNSLKDMEDSLKLEKCFFDRDIALLYKKIGKSKAAEYYSNVYKKCGYNLEMLKRPNESPFYIRLFEGDGKGSLLGNFIPYEKQLKPKEN